MLLHLTSFRYCLTPFRYARAKVLFQKRRGLRRGIPAEALEVLMITTTLNCKFQDSRNHGNSREMKL